MSRWDWAAAILIAFASFVLVFSALDALDQWANRRRPVRDPDSDRWRAARMARNGWGPKR